MNSTDLPSSSGLDSGIKIRPLKKDLDIIGEAFRKRWQEYYAPAPDKPVLWLGMVALYAWRSSPSCRDH